MTYSLHALTQARLWLANRHFPDVSRDYILADATDSEIIHALERHYAGGWHEFLVSFSNTSQPFELRTYSL